MKCMNCGLEFERDYDFCPNCGTAMNQVGINGNPAAEKMLAVMRDSLFLVICILMSVSCGASLLSGSVPLINGLITAFLWVAFAQSRKNVASSKYLRCVSGTVFANYVIMYVLSGLCVLLGALLALVFSYASGNPDLMNAILFEIDTLDAVSADVLQTFLSASGLLIFVLFVLFAIIIAVINALALRPIHRLAKSAYQSIDQGVWMPEKVGAAKGWLWVLGIFAGLGAVSSLTDGSVLAALSNGGLAAAEIIAALMIGKYCDPAKPAAVVVNQGAEPVVLPEENNGI